MENSVSRKRLKDLEVMVAEVIHETWDTSTLVLFTGNDTLDYEAGHFITIEPHQFPGIQRWAHFLEDQKGKPELPRAYSLASAPDEQYLAITVKEEAYISGITPYPPLLSPILAKRTPVGTRMIVTGFTGPYTLSEEVRSSIGEVVHICAGSGIVPSYSIIKNSLRNHSKLKQTLVYSNKTTEDIIYLDDLLNLEKEYPDRFTVYHFLTRIKGRPDFSPRVHSGRVNLEMLTRIFAPLENPRVFVCGPGLTSHQKKDAKARGVLLQPLFLESILEMLGSLGVDKKRIKKESYG